MPPLPPFLLNLVSMAAYAKYPLIFVGSAIEGPFLTIAVGFLLHQDIFDFYLVFLILAAGDLAGDVVWYYIGYYFAEPAMRRHGKFLSVTPGLLEKIKKMFLRRRSVILFFSKITMGFGMALGVLMAAGAARVPLGAYLFYNALGEIVYTAALLAIGYYIGSFYTILAGGAKIVFLAAAIGVVGFVVYGFSQYIKARAMKEL